MFVKTADRLRSLDLKWHGGLRYPRVTKTGGTDIALDTLPAPEP